MLGCSEPIHYRHGNIHEHQLVGVYVLDILVDLGNWTSFRCHPLMNKLKGLLPVVCLVWLQVMVNLQDRLQAQNVEVVIINNENLGAWTLTRVLHAASSDLLTKLSITLCLSVRHEWRLDKVRNLVDLKRFVIFDHRAFWDVLLLVGCVFERFPLFTNLSSWGCATSCLIPNGSELAGHANLIIIGIIRGVSEAVVIAHAQGSELAHEVLIPST